MFLPLMTQPAPDTAERKRLEMQAVPFALPPQIPDKANGESKPQP